MTVEDPDLRGRRCRCMGCGRLFTSPTAFDKHQRMTDRRPHVECLSPDDVGLTDRSKVNDVGAVWGFPGTFAPSKGELDEGAT